MVPDNEATPVAFHDVILEDLVSTPDSRAKLIIPCEVTSLRRRWPSAVFEHMHKRQADMEYLRHACQRQYDSEFGGGRAGTCPHCGIYIACNLGRHAMKFSLGSWSAVAVPSGVVHCRKGVGEGLPGSPAQQT